MAGNVRNYSCLLSSTIGQVVVCKRDVLEIYGAVEGPYAKYVIVYEKSDALRNPSSYLEL